MQPIENNVYYPLGPKSLSAKIIRGLSVPIIILLITGVSFFIKDSEFAVMIETWLHVNLLTYLVSFGVILAFLLGIIQAIISWLHYKDNTFMVSDNALYIRTGILQRNEISVPLRHISNILQQQGIMDRMLGVCRCEIEVQDDEVSATTSTSKAPDDVILYDVDMNLVVPLRELLLSRSNTQRMVVINK